MTQGKPEFELVIEGENKNTLLSALGIKSRSLLNSLSPNSDALSKLSSQIECNGYYVFTLDSASDILVHGRMFAPAIGITEDPVTGNANGPLGTYLVHHKLVVHNGSIFSFNTIQREAIGRQGQMEVEVKNS